MRTTLNLEDGLLRAAKKEAAARGVTLTRVIEEALRGEFAARSAPDDFRLRLPIVAGRRPSEVDIADRDALREAMEERPDRS